MTNRSAPPVPNRASLGACAARRAPLGARMRCPARSVRAAICAAREPPRCERTFILPRGRSGRVADFERRLALQVLAPSAALQAERWRRAG
eukprot:364577-Chlamydomonas_euryale.AAC.17